MASTTLSQPLRVPDVVPRRVPGADRLERLISEQEQIFLRRRPGAARWHARAVESLAGGVNSSWQMSRPEPIWLSHGAGSRVWDVDGHTYVDITVVAGLRTARRRRQRPLLLTLGRFARAVVS